jgi:putative nucleotidyltransferase with HDIG domain
MRRVKIAELKLGMIVARNIYDSDGRILLHTGVQLSDNYITRLNQMGIASVYIKDEFDEFNIPVVDVVSEQTRVETIKIIKQNFELLENNHKIDTRTIKKMVDYLIDELLANYNVLISLNDIRSFDDYTFAHSVNVCILSIMTGMSLLLNDLKLKELGVGALLHDIGKTKIDKAILNKAGDLTKEEFAEIKRHTQYGFEILRAYDEFPLLAAHVAYQHHERWDGNGYPRQLAGENIQAYARIVATADVYDALLADRPYRPSYSINQAITILKNMAGIYLDARCVTALIANIAVYPVGSLIKLNTGEIGIVMDNNKEFPTRPVVRIIIDNTRHSLVRQHEIDLSKLSSIIIVKALSDEDIAELKKE